MEILRCIILLAVVTVGIVWFCLERKEKQERRELEGRYFKVKDELKERFDKYFEVKDELNELKDEKVWLEIQGNRLLKENNKLKDENGWLEEERERLLKENDELKKENDELEDRCIELSKSAVIEELFEGAKEKLDEYVQKIARKE